MDWFQSKAAQIIALVSIIGTLAGFGYTGATYINRLENLENKIGGVDEAEESQKVIEERFAEAAPKPMLYRPKATYVGKYDGPQGCKFIPIEKR